MLVSVCIPTKDRVLYLKETLDSIINDNVNPELYEIVISDNSDDNKTKLLAEQYLSAGVNIVYYKNLEKGFYNSIQALKLGNGEFLKLHNDYTKFKPKAFQLFVNMVEKNKKNKPQTLFTDGNLKKNVTIFSDKFDKFIRDSSYWNTWSSAFSIWKEDFEQLNSDKDILDDQFPHTSLLFQLKNKKSFLVDDVEYFSNSVVSKKGGYNIFYNFCVVYIEMLKDLNDCGVIARSTFNYVKNKMKREFIPLWYYLTVESPGDFSFNCENVYENIRKHYSVIDYLEIIMRVKVYKLYKVLRNKTSRVDKCR